jgi:hypothetical protein
MHFSLKAKRKLLLSSLAFLLISCGGGSSSDTNTPTPTPTPVPTPTPIYHDITAIDGYIRGAIAFIDINNNKILDDDEPWIETGPSGFGQIDRTSLTLTAEVIKVIVTVPPGAIDESTMSSENPDGIAITEETAFQMRSLPGENIATPLTTLVSMIAESDGNIDVAKTTIATSLGITIADISSDYIKADNQELTVLTELIIANQIIPQDLTTTATAGELLVATTVSSQISSVVQQANESGLLSQNSEVIGALANATSSAVIQFVQSNNASLTNETSANFTAVIGLINKTVYSSFESLVTSIEEISAEDIAQASQQANIMGAVVVDLFVENIGSTSGIAEENIADALVILDVISEVVEAVIKDNLDDSIDVGLLTEIAIIATEAAEEQLAVLKSSDLTDEQIIEALAVAAAEIAANLEEAAASGIELDDFDGDGIVNSNDTDIDGDGILNDDDAFDYDATESIDTDLDGIGDNSDPDIDGDSILNDNDAFPLNSLEWLDTDLDGVGDNSDPDIDGDSILNDNDAFPLDNSEWIDNDGDGIGDNADTDDNGDGIIDTEITVMAQDKDSIIDDAQDFVFSSDGKFMYVGSVNGLVVITMGDDGKPTETARLVTPSELGLEKITHSNHLDFSSDGNLYWSLRAEKGEVLTGAIMVLTVDSSDGSVANSQFTHLSEISELSVSIIEIFKISSNNRFLYATAHYGASGNNLLVYSMAMFPLSVVVL